MRVAVYCFDQSVEMPSSYDVSLNGRRILVVVGSWRYERDVLIVFLRCYWVALSLSTV